MFVSNTELLRQAQLTLTSALITQTSYFAVPLLNRCWFVLALVSLTQTSYFAVPRLALPAPIDARDEVRFT